MSIKKTISKHKNTSTELSIREAPAERSIQQSDVLLPLLSTAQMRLVMNKTPDYAIKQRPGPGGVYKYVKHGYVSDQLNKIFGFDWDFVLTPMADGKMYELQLEQVNVYKKPGVVDHVDTKRHLAVCGYVEARIHDKTGKVIGTLKKSGFGSQIWLPTTEFGDSLKGAESDLLKVCAQRIGIALDLYWDDDAEFEKHQADQMKRDEQTNEISQLTSAIPTTLAVLISRAMAEHGIDMDQLQALARSPIGEMMTWDPAQIATLWKKVQQSNVVEGKII